MTFAHSVVVVVDAIDEVDEEGGRATGGNEKRLKNAGYADCGNNSRWLSGSGGGGGGNGGVVKIPIPGTMAPGFAPWKPAN